MRNEKLKIGVFDSGLGGLTVVKALTQVIQNAHIYYVADTKNAPYGEKTPEEIRCYALGITQYLIKKHRVDAVILACNTATSFAIKKLREMYPNLIIIGTEPGVKPAIEKTQTGNIGIMATPATLKSQKYKNLVQNLTKEHEVCFVEQACPGLVEQIEKGEISSDKTKILLEQWLEPMMKSSVDTLVLGCTHYPLVSSLIKDITPDIILIQTGKAIAKRLLALASEKGYQNTGSVYLDVFTTGDINTLLASKILEQKIGIKSISIDYS